MKKSIRLTVSGGFLLCATFNAYSFNVGDVISYDPGQTGCLMPGAPQLCLDYPQYFQGVMDGSYIAVDVNANGLFDIYERIAISPGPDGGIIVGSLQPASGSHSGCPDGSEDPSVDQPWCFFANTGMQQITDYPVYDNQDGTLDFRGWSVTWNGIPKISLSSMTGQANLTCSDNPCTTSSDYSIDYVAYVPLNDPSNFGGVGFQIHLEQESPQPTITVSINVSGGVTQECAAIGGHVVSSITDIQLLHGAVVDRIEWSIDGHPVGAGENFSEYLALGQHTLQVTVYGVSGIQASDVANVTIVDTTPPELSSSFIDSRSGEIITSIDTKNTSFVSVSMSTTDVCDASPSLEGIGGFSLVDGELLKVQGNLDKVELTTSILEMSVDSFDGSGNHSVQNRTLTIAP